MGKSQQLAAFAHHQAGHAVAHLYLDLDFFSVTIEPNTDDLAEHINHRCTRWPPKYAGFEFDCSAKTRERAERHIVALYAGPLAQARFQSRGTWRRDAKTDYLYIMVLFSRICDRDDVCQRLHAKLLWHRAEALVSVCWPEIEAVAQALLKRRQLSYAEVLHEGGYAQSHRLTPRSVSRDYITEPELITDHRRAGHRPVYGLIPDLIRRFTPDCGGGAPK